MDEIFEISRTLVFFNEQRDGDVAICRSPRHTYYTITMKRAGQRKIIVHGKILISRVLFLENVYIYITSEILWLMS